MYLFYLPDENGYPIHISSDPSRKEVESLPEKKENPLIRLGNLEKNIRVQTTNVMGKLSE